MQTAAQQLTLRNHSNAALPPISKNIRTSAIENRRKLPSWGHDLRSHVRAILKTRAAHAHPLRPHVWSNFDDMTAAVVSVTWV